MRRWLTPLLIGLAIAAAIQIGTRLFSPAAVSPATQQAAAPAHVPPPPWAVELCSFRHSFRPSPSGPQGNLVEANLLIKNLQRQTAVLSLRDFTLLAADARTFVAYALVPAPQGLPQQRCGYYLLWHEPGGRVRLSGGTVQPDFTAALLAEFDVDRALQAFQLHALGQTFSVRLP